MNTLLGALNVFLPVLYVAAAFLHAMHFGGPKAPQVARARHWSTAVVLVAALAAYAARWQVYQVFPVFDAWSTLSGVAFALVLLHVVTAPRASQAGLGAVVITVAALLQTLASAFGPLGPPERTVEAVWHHGSFYLFHTGTSVFAAAALVLSGLEGVIYLLILKQMRHRRLGPFVRMMPSLRMLARHTRRAALGGFVLLTVGVNFGIGWAHYAGVERFGYTDPFVLAMLVLWIHFGVVAFSRRIPGFSAQRASVAAVAGLTVFLAISLLTLIPRVSFHWTS